jgi:hypothetical protein
MKAKLFLLTMVVVIGAFVALGASKVASGNNATIKTAVIDEIMSQ